MMKHICPDWVGPETTELKGCGNTFEQEPDHEGWVDCPICGLAFNAARVAKEAEALGLKP